MAERKVFTSQKIRILFDGGEATVQALVSTQGAKNVFDEIELPWALRDTLGQEIDIIYKDIPGKARLHRERSTTGPTYNLKFVNPSPELLRRIEMDIKESGLPSPWRRALPRIPAEESSNLPTPALVLVFYGGRSFYLTIRNFTLGGLLCEYVGTELRSLLPGAKIDFDLVTNFGDKIPDLSAVICHVSEEEVVGQPESIRLFFGIRFLPMSFSNDLKYRNLIREHCLGLRDFPES